MDNVVPAGPPSFLLSDLHCPRSAPAPEGCRSCRAEPHASRSWQKLGQSSAAVTRWGNRELRAQAGGVSGAPSVIFKEHFGGQEASGEESWGRGSLLNTSTTSLHTSSSSQNSTLRSTAAV